MLGQHVHLLSAGCKKQEGEILHFVWIENKELDTQDILMNTNRNMHQSFSRGLPKSMSHFATND